MAALLTRMSMPPHFSTSSRVIFFIPTRSTTDTFALNARRLGFDLADHLGGKVVARVIAESHICPLAGKHLAHCRTNATRSSSDERLLSLKQKTHSVIFSPNLCLLWLG